MKDILLKAWRHMCESVAMSATYEANKHICKYVHATSRGHEAIQLAVGFNLLPCDYVSPYYRDESMLLGMGFTPEQLMLQLLAKASDPFSGGRAYYAHPNSIDEHFPKIIHQSSATGMQAIPTTGVAQGIKYLEYINSPLLKTGANGEKPVVICSFGDASVTEGEVSEALQFAALHQLPIIFLVQDNDWGISVSSAESRNSNAYEYTGGFKHIMRISIDGSDFEQSFLAVKEVVNDVRLHRRPWMIHATVPLLTHHTSGVRHEFYRSVEDWEVHAANDPVKKLKERLLSEGIDEVTLQQIRSSAEEYIQDQFHKATAAPEPDASTALDHIFAPTPVIEEVGNRSPVGNQPVLMVDAALFAIREIMEEHPEAILYGQDVGLRLGGVFREAATLAEQFGNHRVFNTAIQEAYIIGSTVGVAATGVKPFVEVQFADYIFPGFNQLVIELAKSCYLTNGKYPVQTVIRVPIGAYSGGGPYHSASIESTLLTIKGIKVVYPSNAADMKGLMKAAFLDPNPVLMLEHKGLYWSKVPGTAAAKTIEPDRDYILPLGKGSIVKEASPVEIDRGNSICIITYGMGVYWSVAAEKIFPGRVEIIDLRTLFPLDEELVFKSVKKHGKCLVVTEEQQNNSFAEALSGRISKTCFKYLDAPVEVIGAANVPAIPLNTVLEKAILPNAEKVRLKIQELFNY